jgi:hypothetical protein
MYMLAYMDRINVGILLPYIQKDMNLSSSAVGEIAGIFFWGDMLLQFRAGSSQVNGRLERLFSSSWCYESN